MEWYFAESGQQIGPLTDETFHGFVSSGRIASETLVWREGMASWQPYGAGAAELIPAVAPNAPAIPHIEMQACSECGRRCLSDDLAAFGPTLVCDRCKPIFVQRLREGLLPLASVPYGGFWIRFLAVFIDGLILAAVSMAYTPFFTVTGFDPKQPARFFILIGILSGIQFVIRMVYETWFVGNRGATPGKMICGLKVVRPDGRPLTYARAFCRYLAKLLDDFTLLIGYLIAAFDDEKRALHDRLCDTRVVRA